VARAVVELGVVSACVVGSVFDGAGSELVVAIVVKVVPSVEVNSVVELDVDEAAVVVVVVARCVVVAGSIVVAVVVEEIVAVVVVDSSVAAAVVTGSVVVSSTTEQVYPQSAFPPYRSVCCMQSSSIQSSTDRGQPSGQYWPHGQWSNLRLKSSKQRSWLTGSIVQSRKVFHASFSHVL